MPPGPGFHAGGRPGCRPDLFRGPMHTPPRTGVRAPRGRVTGMLEPSAAPARTTMARNASVSVIIPTWNEAKYLPALLDSLQNQTRSPLEILIADSESTDGTQDLAEARGALLVPGDPRGPGEGRNRGARAARGDVFLFVDADCITPPDLLDAIVAAFEEPGVIGGATGFMPALGNAAERALFSLANGYQRAMTLWGFPHNAGYCFFFRREAFQALGGLREDMPLNETHDLALRSRSLGRFVILPQAVLTSMRRFRTYGYVRTILKEYIASTILYYATGRTSAERFRPAPAR
ncbi:MAG: glycosyltransferase [Methanobacteriota archaeon]|nr:MAG: glycosyltransferase [Euryarchaeota archaeon]